MNTKDNNFKKSLKCNVSSSIFDLLNLNNLEDKIDLSFSDDLNFIKINLKGSDIYFNFPISSNDFTLFKNHPNYDKLVERYKLYQSDYFKKIINHIKHERLYLKENLPDVNFYSRIRVKSPFSYSKKMNERILNNEYLNINDIIGQKIVITDVNGSKDSKVLEKACYNISKAIDDFRKTSDFIVKKPNDSNNSFYTDINYISKDFIKNPKKNGYQSLHIFNEDSKNPDCCFETQIRTFPMEEMAKKDVNVAHNVYKKRYLDDLSISRMPKYIEITDFPDKNGLPSLYIIPSKYAFHHYYGITYDEYIEALSKLNEVVNIDFLKTQIKNLSYNKSFEQLKL